MFLTEGRARCEQGARLDARAGDVVLVPAGQPHRTQVAQTTAGWGVAICAPSIAASDLAPLLAPFEHARDGGTPVIAIPASRHAHLAALCAELRDETARPSADGLAARSLLALVLTEVARAAAATPTAPHPTSVVGAALRFIERRCLEPISLRDVAHAVGRSPSYVTTAVKRATGQPVGAWITAGRLAHARRHLLHGDERVDLVGERVGYADPTHFIRQFRRAHGVTPAAWRAAHRR